MQNSLPFTILPLSILENQMQISTANQNQLFLSSEMCNVTPIYPYSRVWASSSKANFSFVLPLVYRDKTEDNTMFEFFSNGLQEIEFELIKCDSFMISNKV